MQAQPRLLLHIHSHQLTMIKAATNQTSLVFNDDEENKLIHEILWGAMNMSDGKWEHDKIVDWILWLKQQRDENKVPRGTYVDET